MDKACHAMRKHFLSVVLIVSNQEKQLDKVLTEGLKMVRRLASEYELIVVDNASSDGSVEHLRSLTSKKEFENTHVIALTKSVNMDTASWLGLEHALGDYVIICDPLLDDMQHMPKLLHQARQGVEVVLCKNQIDQPESRSYQFGKKLFDHIYRLCTGIHLTREAPPYRLLSRRVVNFILQHQQPATMYRHLPLRAGFRCARIEYCYRPKANKTKKLVDSFDHGMSLLLSSSKVPMRIVTFLSLFGAVANLLYSIYILFIALLKTNVAPGWTSLSLQQSGMFFLISLVLFMIGEFILHTASYANDSPRYHIADDFCSQIMTHRPHLNIEENQNSEALSSETYYENV